MQRIAQPTLQPALVHAVVALVCPMSGAPKFRWGNSGPFASKLQAPCFLPVEFMQATVAFLWLPAHLKNETMRSKTIAISAGLSK